MKNNYEIYLDGVYCDTIGPMTSDEAISFGKWLGEARAKTNGKDVEVDVVSTSPGNESIKTTIEYRIDI